MRFFSKETNLTLVIVSYIKATGFVGFKNTRSICYVQGTFSLCAFCTPISSSSIYLLRLCWGREMLDYFYGFEIGLMHTAWQ